jgi:hypothetical protein
VKHIVRRIRDRLAQRPVVRPWALLGPIVVLVIALPLLRPLRHPSDVSNHEQLRLATVRALVEQRTLALDGVLRERIRDGVVHRDDHTYSEQPPMLAVLLSLPAWVMTRVGLSFDENPLLLAYMLTLIGVTLPVALSAGLVYRMGRMFELRRPWRAALGIAVVLGSGMISYAVVINQHAPAAALVIAAAACLAHVSAVDRAGRRWIWLLLAGLFIGFAATIDPPAVVLALLFMFVIAAMRFPIGLRAAGVVLYLIGASVPALLHVRFNETITGDWIPATLHERSFRRSTAAPPLVAPGEFEFEIDDDEPASAAWTSRLYRPLRWLGLALFGAHGLISHFPIVVIGVAGVFAVMHRHWPSSTKVLAAATLVGSVTIVLMYCIWRADFRSAMFGARWFILFMPMLLFWVGAWVRRSHRPATWVLAGVLLLFSTVVSLVGATGPYPSTGYHTYTAAAAVKRLLTVHPTPAGEEAVAGGRSGL